MTGPGPLALVTGASSGIRFGLARRFADRGSDLVVDVEDAGLTTGAGRLRKAGTTVQAVQAEPGSGE